MSIYGFREEWFLQATFPSISYGSSVLSFPAWNQFTTEMTVFFTMIELKARETKYIVQQVAFVKFCIYAE